MSANHAQSSGVAEGRTSVDELNTEIAPAGEVYSAAKATVEKTEAKLEKAERQLEKAVWGMLMKPQVRSLSPPLAISVDGLGRGRRRFHVPVLRH